MGVEVADSIGALSADWDDLAARTSAPPFLRPGYVGAWCSAFASGPLEVIALRRDGGLAGVLPLERRGRVLASTANAWTELFSPLAEDGEAARALASAAFERAARRVELEFLPADAEETAALRAAASEAGYRVLERVLQRSPYVPLEAGWDAYAAALDTKLRREVRRRTRRLEEEGELRLEVADGRERLGELLEEGFAVEAAAWKGSAGTSIASTPESLRFYRELARWAAAQGILRLGFLRLDGRPLAFDFCLEDGRAHYLLKTGYDPEHRALAPGIIMRWEMIKRAFEAGLETYEFLGKDQEWKLRWADARRERVRLRAFARSPGGRLDHVLHARARPLAKRLLRRT